MFSASKRLLYPEKRQLEDVRKTLWHLHMPSQLKLSLSFSVWDCETSVPDYKGRRTMLICKLPTGAHSSPKAGKSQCPSSKALNQEKSGEIHSCSYLEQSYSFCSSQAFNFTLRKSLLYFLYDLNVNLIQSPPHSNTEKHA